MDIFFYDLLQNMRKFYDTVYKNNYNNQYLYECYPDLVPDY